MPHRLAPISPVLLATALVLFPQPATAADRAPSTALLPLTLDPAFTQQAYVKASDTWPHDAFSRVAISGDTLVVGAAGADTDSGAVYVFVRSAGAWTQQAYLKASNAEAGDMFGFSVAISGDTLVVGAPLEDSNATGVDGDQANDSAIDAGAAYVFVRSAGAWSQQAYLKASNTSPDPWRGYFGVSVAISGDTLVVGRPNEDSCATGVNGDQWDASCSFAGAAYVFVRSAGAWSQQAYLKASNTSLWDLFGSRLAISGDTIVVGSPWESSKATGVNGDQSIDPPFFAGAAYVFVRSAGLWSQQAYLKASNTGFDDKFGFGVAISGDTIVVGTSYEDSSATGVDGDQANDSAPQSGAAYVFVRSAGTWSQQAYLKASNTGADDGFGEVVAISGDTLVIGAPGEDSSAGGGPSDNSAPQSGAAYVFRRSSVWSQQAHLKASNADQDDRFGSAVAISGDTLVIGAPGEDSSATGIDGDGQSNNYRNAGAAYVFVPLPGANLEMAKVADIPNPLPGETVVFTLTATNQGFGAATGVTVTDTLPAGLTYGGNDCGATFTSPILTWTIGSLADLAFAACRLTAIVDAGASGTIVNSAAVTANEMDPVPGNNSASASITVPADLAIVKTADDTAPLLDGTVVFTLTVTNQGPGGASGVTVTDILPAGLTYGSNDCGAAFASPALTWTIGTLAPLASVTCHLAVTVHAAGTIVNTAAVDGNESDPQIGDNTDDATLTVPIADLEIKKTADNPAPEPGTPVVFTLTVTNRGPASATGVVVTDTLPATLSYESDDCGAAFASPTLTWTIGTLAYLASATCHLTVTVDAGAAGTVVNTAAVDGNAFDPQVGDNAADAVLSLPMELYILTPCRLVDTRLADGPLGGPALAAKVPRELVLAGACGVPADAAAVVLNVTAVWPTAPGSVQIYKAGGTPLAGAGTVRYRAGVTRAGNGIVMLGEGGAIVALAEQPAGTVHLILDVAGYFF